MSLRFGKQAVECNRDNTKCSICGNAIGIGEQLMFEYSASTKEKTVAKPACIDCANNPEAAAPERAPHGFVLSKPAGDALTARVEALEKVVANQGKVLNKMAAATGVVPW